MLRYVYVMLYHLNLMVVNHYLMMSYFIKIIFFLIFIF